MENPTEWSSQLSQAIAATFREAGAHPEFASHDSGSFRTALCLCLLETYPAVEIYHAQAVCSKNRNRTFSFGFIAQINGVKFAESGAVGDDFAKVELELHQMHQQALSKPSKAEADTYIPELTLVENDRLLFIRHAYFALTAEISQMLSRNLTLVQHAALENQVAGPHSVPKPRL